MNTLEDVKLLEAAVYENGMFEECIACVIEAFSAFPDNRTGKNTQYTMVDAALAAFAVFFTQSPSWLAYQKAMENAHGKSNAQTLFRITQIPTDNRVRGLLDPVSPRLLDSVFIQLLRMLEKAGALAVYTGVNGYRLVALDGTQFHSSEKIHCESCSVKKHANGRTTYSHTVVTPVLVSPVESRAIPLRPEFVIPQDGHDKQDCEIAAAKRWVEAEAALLAESPTVLLGDDLYAHNPFCRWALRHECHFIFTCLRTSHQTVYKYIDLLEPCDIGQVQERRKNKFGHMENWTVRYALNVPLSGNDDALNVNWVELIVTDTDGKERFHNTWITDLDVSEDNAIAIAESGRARWVIENGNNNVLKTKGYHLEHNFGHGSLHLATLLLAMNILAFLLHTALEFIDEQYKLIRAELPRRDMFHQHITTLTTYLCFPSWRSMLIFMMKGLEIGPFAPSEEEKNRKKRPSKTKN
jgi:hypothetical protein